MGNKEDGVGEGVEGGWASEPRKIAADDTFISSFTIICRGK